MAYGLSNSYVTGDVTWPRRSCDWGSTVGYPSDSLASCITNWLPLQSYWDTSSSWHRDLRLYQSEHITVICVSVCVSVDGVSDRSADPSTTLHCRSVLTKWSYLDVSPTSSPLLSVRAPLPRLTARHPPGGCVRVLWTSRWFLRGSSDYHLYQHHLSETCCSTRWGSCTWWIVFKSSSQ